MQIQTVLIRIAIFFPIALLLTVVLLSSQNYLEPALNDLIAVD